MMTGYLRSVEGETTRLPPWISWKLKRTGTVPCDSFEGVCIWDADGCGALERANRLILEEDGVRRFTGVVDECELRWGSQGGTLALSGRGLAALLLDNEAAGQDYQVATLADIIRNHVEPLGLETDQLEPLPPVNGFSVPAGSSEWQVLDSFARYHSGVQPRFDVYGRVCVSRSSHGKRVEINEKTGVTEVVWQDRPCKVCSEVVVRPRGPGMLQRVVNESFLVQGGRRRRVITMPRKSGYQAMRYSGQFQLDQSALERRRLELTVPGDYFCEPGDLIQLSLYRPQLSGQWTVLETEASADHRGSRVKLILG